MPAAPFWSGPKRAPNPLKFNPEDPLHLNFVISAANLRAANYRIERDPNVDQLKKALANVPVPEFAPKKVKIQTNENEQNQQQVSELFLFLSSYPSFNWLK